jgi:hypothetical protein
MPRLTGQARPNRPAAKILTLRPRITCRSLPDGAALAAHASWADAVSNHNEWA